VMKNCEPFVLGPAFAVHKNIGSPEKQGELWEIRKLTQGTTVMKNCEPFVFGPALAMDSVYGRSCRRLGWNSSSNSPPHIDSPPVPLPVQRESYNVKVIVMMMIVVLKGADIHYDSCSINAHSRQRKKVLDERG
jgi:hypothetical protein